MRTFISQVGPEHPDYPVLDLLRTEIAARAGGLSMLQARFPGLVREAVDFVLDPVRTARTRVIDLDNVEKTFIGLKLEHFVRDMLDVPKGLRDSKIAGLDVDIKNTVGNNWSIPIETYRASEPCLLMAINDTAVTCSLGLIVADIRYLHQGAGNRDSKRGVSAMGFENILWLVESAPFPPSRFSGLDMGRFRELRKTFLTGNKRVAQFCRENLGKIIHREVMKALLFDQDDYMKRLRKNGGAPDTLLHEGIAFLNGTFLSNRSLAAKFGFNLAQDELVAVQLHSEAEQEMVDRETGCTPLLRT